MKQPVNFHHLQVFLSVAQEGSFSRAADNLRISQPSVSIQIRNLEETLGIKLFERLGRSIHLTAEGRLVLDYAKRLDSLVLNLRGDLENLTQLKTGRLIIGASRVPSTTTVPFAFALFKQKYPQTEIIVQTALSAQVERWVMENEVDLGIVGGGSSSDILSVEPCYEEKLVLVLPSKHPMARQNKIAPRDVLNEPILLPYVGRLTDYVMKAFEKKGLSIEKTVNLGSREAVKAALSAGYGVSIMPKSALELDANSFLVIKKLHGLELTYPVNIIYHKDKHLSRLALAFLAFLRQLKGKKLQGPGR